MSFVRRLAKTIFVLAATFATDYANAAQTDSDPFQGNFVGWSTNGPGVYRLRYVSKQALAPMPYAYSPAPADLPLEIRQGMLAFRFAAHIVVVTNTVPVFDHFVSTSLNNAVWTNFIAHTNGRSTRLWSEQARPLGWPLRAPVVRWNINSLVWGMRGMTALSPCWAGEGPPGQTPITAFTRRHGYTRGHSMGADGFAKQTAGMKVWFLTVENTLVEVKVRREVVRTRETSGRDYTILLFDSDLPESITPMRVVDPKEFYPSPDSRYWYCQGAPFLLFKTEQSGNVSADVPGFIVDTMKGGDSGSPNMVPLPGELVFWNGRTTSPASPEMQADMNQLCRLEGLDPNKYPLQWADLSAYPSY